MVADAGERPLLERAAAVAALSGAVGSVRQGGSAVVFVVGAAGLGKTSLIEFGRREAATVGFSVGSGVGSPMESGLPFGLAGQAIVSLAGSGVEEIVEPGRFEDRATRLYRLFRWLVDRARDAPLMLALDDLQWADPDSLDLLGFLCRRLATSPILVVGSLRPEPDAASTLAHELVGGGWARLLQLAPLSRDASAALLAETVPHQLDTAEVDRLCKACAGTPLLLKAAGWALSGGGSLPELSAEGMFGTSLLLERFVGAGQDAFDYVQAASIFGVRFPIALAGALAGLDDAVAAAAQTRMLRARLLDDLGAGWAAFAHPLFAQALVDAQPVSVRERQHAAAFRLLVAQGAADALAAEHAVAARLEGDPLAIEVTARAGRSAFAQGALEAACVHLSNAVGLAGDAADDALLLDLATSLTARGRFEDADRVCRQLLARVAIDPALRASAIALRARGAMFAARPADAERLYHDAAEAAVLGGPASEVAVLTEAAMTCQVSSPVPWVLSMAQRSLAILPAQAPVRAPLELLAAYESLIGGDPVGVELLTRSAHGWLDHEQHVDDSIRLTLAFHTLNVFKLLEDFTHATQLFEREFARAVRDGSPLLIHALAMAYADALHRLGRPAEALELVQGSAVLIDAPVEPWSEIAAAVLLSELGRDVEADANIDRLRAFLVGMPPEYFAPASLWLDLLDARRSLAAGLPEQASDTMLHAASIAELTGWREPCIVPWAGIGIEAHIAAGRVDSAKSLVEDLEQLAARLPCRWPQTALALGRARLAAADERFDDAEREFDAAITILGGLPMPIAQADALLSYGAYLRRRGKARDAREPLAKALELSERAGSGRVSRLAQAELAATGGRRRRDGDRSALTAHEERVAALAADGMTNAQIGAALHLSPKTVGHHLEHIFAKLGIRSRRDLIRQGRSPS